ncbi:MAG: hypothetical protein ACXV8Q_00610 [Methylobacter sp.]
MTNFARIINNVAVDVSINPVEQFHPDIAAQFEPVPVEVQAGWHLVGSVWTAPESAALPTQFDPVINFSYPIASPKASDITVAVAVVNSVDNSSVPVTETYYVPLMNIITGVMEKMLVIPVVDGIGQVIFSVANAGVVGINVDLIRPKPTAKFSSLPDIAIY